jgi:hypothetical protein
MSEDTLGNPGKRKPPSVQQADSLLNRRVTEHVPYCPSLRPNLHSRSSSQDPVEVSSTHGQEIEEYILTLLG